MRILTPAIALLAVTVMGTQAQDKPAANTQTPPAKTAPAAKKTSGTATSAKPAGTNTAKGAGAVAFKTEKEKFSYALGMNVGTNLGAGLKSHAVDVDPNILAQGVKDALSGAKTRLTPEEAQAELVAMQNQKAQEAGAKNKAEGDSFLAANKSKQGVVTLPSGLQYKILQAGTGPKPTANDTVVCNYRGTLISGTEFDSSYKRGQPATFPVGGVIKGWTEALQLMPVGSKWQLFIPPGLAYGERGAAGGEIGPDSTLIFEVELVSIQEKPKATDAKPEEKK